MKTYINFLIKNGYSKNTITTYSNILNSYSELLHDIRLIKSRILKIKNANTAWTHYNTLLSFMKYKKDKRWIELKRIKIKQIPQIYRDVFSKNSLYKKTRDLSLYKNIIVRLLFETGIRASELKTIHLINTKTFRVVGKGNKVREIFHNHETTRLFNGFEMSTKTLRIWVKEVMGEKFTPHSIRRSHATHMLLRGANPKTVMMQLGHSKVETTYKYLQLSKTNNIKIYNKFF